MTPILVEQRLEFLSICNLQCAICNVQLLLFNLKSLLFPHQSRTPGGTGRALPRR
jgi:hypothetical protein